MTKPRVETLTFKAEASLVEALRGVGNRSAFIREAVLNALANACPLCQGTGVLSPNQKRHWEKFASDHQVRECAECHERHLVCVGGARLRRSKVHCPDQSQHRRGPLARRARS